MKKSVFFIFIFLLLSYGGMAQPFAEELFGFRLGQLKESTHNAFGEPTETGKFSDGFIFEKFDVFHDSTLYIVFEYPNDSTPTIHAIELRGACNSVVFKGLKLGDKEDVIRKILGKPEFTSPIHKGEKWEYPTRNYVLETNRSNKLQSIRIKDITQELYHTYDRKMIPIFKHIIDTFVLREQVLMEPYVSASFHAELDSTNYYFRWGIAQEVKSDTSKVFALLKDLNYGIPVLRKAKKGEIVEVLTFEKKKPPIVTYNCPERFPIEAIILKFFMGRYRIEEIRYRKIIKP